MMPYNALSTEKNTHPRTNGQDSNSDPSDCEADKLPTMAALIHCTKLILVSMSASPTWCWGAEYGWCWAPASLVGVRASKSACVPAHWNSVKGCDASCSCGCSKCPWRPLGWREMGFETSNYGVPPPGSSVGSTAHPQIRGSVAIKRPVKGEENQSFDRTCLSIQCPL